MQGDDWSYRHLKGTEILERSSGRHVLYNKVTARLSRLTGHSLADFCLFSRSFFGCARADYLKARADHHLKNKSNRPLYHPILL